MQFLCFSLVAGLLIARLIDFCFSRCLQGENRLDDTKSSQHITQVSTTRVHERARKNLGRQLRPRMDGGGDERPTRSLSLIVMTRSSDVKLVVLDSPFTRRRAADGFFYPDTRFFSIVQRCQWRHKVFGLIFLPESKGGRCRYKQNEQKKDMDEKEENICIHTRRRSARIQVRTSPPVASCSSGRQTDADPIKIVPPCHIPRYCCRTSVYIASRTSSSELFCFFSPSPVLSSRKIGSLLYIYTNRGKRFSKEIV